MYSDPYYEKQREVEEFKWLLEEKILTNIYPSPDTQVIKIQSRRPTKSAPQHVQRFELQAQPMEGQNESNTNASDGRIQILMTARWPNSVHGVIAFRKNNITTWGTGILIGPHVVLTAGHNLYDFKRKEYVEVESIQYLPGMNGQILPFGVIEVEKAFVSPNYIQSEKEDYGILILKEPIGEMTGYFGLACLESEEIKARKINITGYPGDKVASKSNTYEMWGMEGTAAHIDQARGQINYLIDTSAGQSGSGVWYQEEGDYFVCGIHIFGSWCVNKATLLTRAIYQQIHSWLQEPMSFREQFFKLRDEEGRAKLDFLRMRSGECISHLMRYNLDDLSSLDLSEQGLKEDTVKALAQNVSWIKLSKLDLSNNKIDEKAAKALAQNMSWTKLSNLDLFLNKLNPEAAKELAENISWGNLSVLNLSFNHIGTEGAKALAQNTSWGNLSVLNLSSNHIETEGAKGLAQNTSWINLSVLYLSDNKIGPEGAKELAQNISWTNLSELDLSQNGVDVKEALALAQYTSFTNLVLSFSENKIDTEGAKELAFQSHLSEFRLSWNLLGAEGAKSLSQNISWAKLVKLDLSWNRISSEGAKKLAENTSWINLSVLNLPFNHIGTEGAKGLAENTSWINLSVLNLSSNNIGTEGAKALAENTSWINLSHLDLTFNQIGLEGELFLKRNRFWKIDLTIQTKEMRITMEGLSSLYK